MEYTKIKGLDDLTKIKNQTRTFDQVPEGQVHVVVGMNTCGMACGAQETMTAFKETLAHPDFHGKVFQTGCIGMCFHEPLVDIILPGQPRITYRGLTCDGVSRVVENHIMGGEIVKNWVLAQMPHEAPPAKGIPTYDELPYSGRQHKIVLRKCGFIDPEDIGQYIATNGYFALAKAVLEMRPEDVVETVRASGLRGRGGAGFPTGLKWHSSRNATGNKKYIICNGDEGDPGAFMDRSIMEGDPHSVIEGMMIAGYAVGAEKGIVYVRAEYPLAVKHLSTAIAQATDLGLLGSNILGSGFDFRIEIFKGAGAFVCGESTALVMSIEGKRGLPKSPPRINTSIEGLWGKPTVLNNVETFACVPIIIQKGAEWFNHIGTEKSKGTKVFSLSGDIKKSGLVEVPMGTPLREIVFDIGGGIVGDKKFKAVQTGGPSGGCIPESLLDLPVDYESLADAGSIMGSGGMVVMDETTCMADVVRYFLSFTKSESCGQCTPCREGLERLYDILNRICKGQGRSDDMERLEALALGIQETSLCGLGQSAPNPVVTVLEHFKEEIEAHIVDKQCPAGVCPDLIRFEIDADKCSACGICRKACPVEAIQGKPEVVHEIIQERCIRCGTCYEVCPKKFSAVIRS
jgi:NADH-quinone oxidoreductase subunit F